MMRIAIWSPLPPNPSGIADYVAESLPALALRAELTAVVEDPKAVAPGLARYARICAPADAHEADLDLYHLGNSPAHGYVHRAALARPGVVVLHEWSLHHLVLRETVERGDASAYLKQMRRAYGEDGLLVGRQVARALGGDLWPALYPLNEQVLESSLGVVALSEHVAVRVAARLPGRALLRLPLHASLPAPLPTRAEARRRLGLPADALLVTAPGLATRAKRLDVAVRAVAGLRGRFPSLRLIVAGEVEPGLPLDDWSREAGLGDALLVTGRVARLEDFVAHLVAADVVLSLRFPSHGEMSAALVRALGVGRPVLVTAGTPAAEEFPEGVVVPVDPGRLEEPELQALLARLLEDRPLRERIGALARAHVAAAHGAEPAAEGLAAFLEGLLPRKPSLLAALAAERADEGTLLGDFVGEVRRAARELGLPLVPPGIPARLAELLPGAR